MTLNKDNKEVNSSAASSIEISSEASVSDSTPAADPKPQITLTPSATPTPEETPEPTPEPTPTPEPSIYGETMSIAAEHIRTYYNSRHIVNSLEDGDIEEGLAVASKIGDDYLQKKAYGYTVPDAFNHGRSEQRVKWLKRGLTYGTIKDGDTFSPPYNAL